jgi:hypothetical protein
LHIQDRLRLATGLTWHGALIFLHLSEQKAALADVSGAISVPARAARQGGRAGALFAFGLAELSVPELTRSVSIQLNE